MLEAHTALVRVTKLHSCQHVDVDALTPPPKILIVLSQVSAHGKHMGSTQFSSFAKSSFAKMSSCILAVMLSFHAGKLPLYLVDQSRARLPQTRQLMMSAK